MITAVFDWVLKVYSHNGSSSVPAKGEWMSSWSEIWFHFVSIVRSSSEEQNIQNKSWSNIRILIGIMNNMLIPNLKDGREA